MSGTPRSDQTTEKLGVSLCEDWDFEQTVKDSSDSENQTINASNVIHTDENLLTRECEQFGQQFLQLQALTSSVIEMSLSTRNSKVIGEVTRDMIPAIDTLSNLRQEMLDLIERGKTQMQNASLDVLHVEDRLERRSSNNGKRSVVECYTM